MCYIVVLRDMVKERWWSATDVKHRKHVKTCYLRVRVSLGIGLGFRDKVRVSVLVRVSLGFRDRVRVKVRVSFRLATFMYSVWPPVSLRVRVSLGLGFRDKVRVSVLVRVKVRVSYRLANFMYSVWPPVPHFPYTKPKNFSVPF